MQYSNNTTPSKSIPIKDRDFEEVDGGYYDHNGWYITPNGSFWDENGTYFNREGMDIHGGFFDEYSNYIPGPDWNPDLCSYNEKENLKMSDSIKIKINEKLEEELIDDYEYYEKYFSNTDKIDVHNDEINDYSNLPLRESYSHENEARNI